MTDLPDNSMIPFPGNGILTAAVPQAPGGLPLQLPRCPELAKALGAAQQKVRAVGKDAYNDFHKYSYTSAEAVLREAQHALEGCGLAVLCSAPHLRATSVGNTAFYEAVREVALVHSSGECFPLGQLAWPVVPERGRPLDKAFAIALTSSLAYLLRDLLLMPRVKRSDDMSAQEDRTEPAAKGAQRPAAPAAPAPAPRQLPPCITEVQAQEIERLLVESRADVKAFLTTYAIPVVTKLPVEHFEDARRKLLKKIDKAKAEAGTPAADPTTAPPATMPTPVSPGPPSETRSEPTDPAPDRDYQLFLRQLHSDLARKGRSWRSALIWVGVQLPENWEDPESDVEIDALAAFLPRTAAEKIAKQLAPQNQGKGHGAGMNVLDLEQRTPAWHAWRSHGVGGSDAVTIMGQVIDPDRPVTVADLIDEKLGRHQRETTFAMRRGVRLEPVALHALARETGMIFHPACIEHAEATWLRASLDGLSFLHDLAVELKCPRVVEHEIALGGVVPRCYWPQVQHLLLVTDLPLLWYVSYSEANRFGGPTSPSLALVEVEPDEAYLPQLIEKETAFWEKLCQAREEAQHEDRRRARTA